MQASDTHRIIIISLSRVQNIAKEFRNGDRRTTTRAERSRRPTSVSACTDENVNVMAKSSKIGLYCIIENFQYIYEITSVES